MYRIVYTHEAEQDIVNIYRYVAFSLQVSEVARKQTDRIMESIAKLDCMPFRHEIYQEEPWYSRGLRFFYVDNYLVFYVAEEQEKTVAIIRIIYGKRNIDMQLSSSD